MFFYKISSKAVIFKLLSIKPAIIIYFSHGVISIKRCLLNHFFSLNAGFCWSVYFSLFMLSCSSAPDHSKARVHIEKKNNRFILYKDHKPYSIKGASGFSHLDILKEMGGNTIRIWDTTRLSSILKEANKNGIAVIVGLPIPQSRHLSFYNDTAKVIKQYQAIKQIVNLHKSDPAILMWCVGNELSFPNKWTYANFYSAYNDIVDLIHQDDPDHPVTTTIVNFQQKDIFNIKMRTSTDIISFNIFGKLRTLEDDLNKFSWFYDDPYLITEWAIDGPWDGTPHTAWQAYIEPSSTRKAEYYLQRYQLDMPVNDPRFLGSCMFYWGQKQEVTSTWFSLFDQEGNQTAAVLSAKQIWTGKKSTADFPKVMEMLMDHKKAADNIIYEPGVPAHAGLLMENTTKSIVKVKWEIYKEDWYKNADVNNSKALRPVPANFSYTDDFQVTFTTPQKEGPYRIFVTVYDHQGHIANSNLPFYISGNHEKK